jgi:hypothetical protein
MEPIRFDQLHPASAPPTTINEPDPRLVELLRAALRSLAAEPKKEEKEKKPEEQMPLFWKLCSAALLSISAMIVVTLYNQLNTTGNQLRSDVNQLRNDLSQLRNDLVPRDDYNARTEQTVSSIKEVQANNKAASDAWRDRGQEQRATVADLRLQIKELERDLQHMREQLSVLEREALPVTPSPLPRERGKGP